MKRYLLSVACCVSVFLAAGLTNGQTMEMHRYYGAGPNVSPPYWKVPDLTKAAEAEAAVCESDLTEAQKAETAYPGVVPRGNAALKGEEIGQRQYFKRPRTYVDHSTGIFSQMATRTEASSRHLNSAPSAPSQANRSLSFRTFEFAYQRTTMQRHLNRTSSYQPR